jgi:hypothetical protein
MCWKDQHIVCIMYYIVCPLVLPPRVMYVLHSFRSLAMCGTYVSVLSSLPVLSCLSIL